MELMQKAEYRVDLIDLHALYERNYIRLMQLLPTMREREQSHCIAFMPSEKIATRLRLTVIENSPYTSYILLKQDNVLAWLNAPDFYIRCYHDARLAEIEVAQHKRSFKGVYTYPNQAMHHPDEKKQLNQLLGEWLARCLNADYEMTSIKLTS